MKRKIPKEVQDWLDSLEVEEVVPKSVVKYKRETLN